MASIEKREAGDGRISYQSWIGPHAQGQSLVGFLSSRFQYFDQDQWRRCIESLDVQVNGGRAEADQILKSGDRVQYFAMKKPEPKVPLQIPVVYQDEDLLIVNKPPHIPVHPTGRYLRNTLIHVLQKQTKLDFLVLSHRLDRETSGLCVLSKTPLAKDKMYWQFFNGEIEKTYWALVWGRPTPPSGLVDAPLGLATPEQSPIRIKQVVRGKDSKTARTKYHTLGTKWIEAAGWAPPPWKGLQDMMKGDISQGPWPISLVECRPLTGRTNQIRVHLTEVNCGIVGDKLYDPEEAIFLRFKEFSPMLQGEGKTDEFMKLPPDLKRRLILDAHALHARKLTFRHPRSGKRLTLEAPAPRAWKGLF